MIGSQNGAETARAVAKAVAALRARRPTADRDARKPAAANCTPATAAKTIATTGCARNTTPAVIPRTTASLIDPRLTAPGTAASARRNRPTAYWGTNAHGE